MAVKKNNEIDGAIKEETSGAISGGTPEAAEEKTDKKATTKSDSERLDEVEKGLSEILSLLKGGAVPAAPEKKEEQKPVKEEDEYIEHTFPIDERDTSDIRIGINGKLYVIKPGETVRVPKSVVQCYNDSMKAKRELLKKQNGLVSKNLGEHFGDN